MKKCFSHWTPIKHVSDEKLSSIIIKDNIDILIDLSNHTKHNRLAAFARKLAPLQISAVGLASTTGLTSMDYFFGDNVTVRDQDFSECYVGLPSPVVYTPLKEMPPVNKLPALKNGFITFGSFNRTARVTRSCIALWSQLLRQLPNSRLLFAGFADEISLNNFTKWFVEEEIELSRISFHPKTGFDEYCQLHHEVDVHLMSFPFSGGTTISNALWMGVPSLGLAQSYDRLEGGYNILRHAGLQDFYAKDRDDFISKGCYLARELTELASIRANLRKKFASSAFCNPEVSAANWATALRIIWKRWCSDLPPEPIELALND